LFCVWFADAWTVALFGGAAWGYAEQISIPSFGSQLTDLQNWIQFFCV
jgi:hypothetical protein